MTNDGEQNEREERKIKRSIRVEKKRLEKMKKRESTCEKS